MEAFGAEPQTAVRRISLLLISHSYPPVLGGSEMEAQRVCAALIRRGHSVRVLCAGGPPMPGGSRWTDPAGVPVRMFGGRRTGRLRDYAFTLGVVWTLFRERKRYDTAYFLMQGLHLAAGLPVARWLGKPVVMKISGSNVITMMRQSWLGRIELRLLERWARRVMILNPGMAKEAAAAGFRPDRLLWMPNPVDASEFAPCAPGDRAELRARLGIPADARAAIFVGRLAPEKELATLIRAFSAVARDVPGSLLTLVGDGPLRSQLEAQAEALGIGASVRFAGALPAQEVRAWLQASDAFALVSSSEGLPCSLVEAMSVGLPSVVSGIPANVQLIEDGVHGLHAAVGDEASIAAALSRLLQDPAARESMGAASRRRVLESYSTEKVVDRYEALFEEICGRGVSLSSPPEQCNVPIWR